MAAMILLVRFLLTRPSRDVTHHGSNTGENIRISTHTSLAGRDSGWAAQFVVWARISTHTSLAGRDSFHSLLSMLLQISTHTSLAGRDVVRLYAG